MTGKYRSKVRRSAKTRKPPGRKQIIESNVDNCIAVDDESSVDFAAATTTTGKTDDSDISTYSKKFKIDEGFIREKQSKVANDLYSWCYLLFDIRCILDMVDVVGRCPSCCEKISVYHNMEKKKGLCHYLDLSCTKCDWTSSFSTSKEAKPMSSDKGSGGRNPHDVNIRSVIATREIGRGYTALQSLCGFMNIPPPMTEKTFLQTQSSVKSVYVNVAEENMRSAVEEIKEVENMEENDDEVHNTIISTDGTWQKRGFSSRNGVVSIISSSTGKCLDYRVKTKTCKACAYWKGKTGMKAEGFRRIHKCPLNHTT